MIATLGKHKLETGSWNALTFRQLLTFCRLSASDIDAISLKTKLFCAFFNLKPLKKKPVNYKGSELFWFIKGWRRILVSVTDINFLSEALLNTFYKKNTEGNYELDVFLSKNIIQPFRVGFLKYYGPADALTNITFREFIYADTFYIEYSATKNVKNLDKLIGVLFRRKKAFLSIVKHFNSYNNDPRIKFNDNLIDRYAKSAKNLPIEVKTAILYYYIGCRRFIATEFEEVFTTSGGSGTTDSDTFKMYLRVTDLLAKSNPLDKELIRDQMLFDVLDTLNNLLLNNKPK